MAKYVASKQKAQKRTVHPDLMGTLGKNEVTLTYNKGTNRYDLANEGKLVLSHASHAACLSRAAKHKMVWG